ncbi:putative 1-phosphatidylinositol phosphodiesterase precursor [Triangularia verruculosa]|uniref:1-phosphatidylinositol phosphodiesterase n=1 Tax=Triangularia verruculosa TaxID=2587418 RepID=A0AAN6XRC1_9PEZI|nr:putative 1-phosphatidylinositol phosphodiesterase precursor [Triangularia verruculosa]
MGGSTSRPRRSLPAMPETITIRNLTLTPLKLKLVERLEPPVFVALAQESNLGSDNITRMIVGRRHSPDSKTQQGDGQQGNEAEFSFRPHDPKPRVVTASQDLDIPLPPFTESPTTVFPPLEAHHHHGEQVRLTFEEPNTNGQGRYTCEIPGLSEKSIELTFVGDNNANAKEITAIYLPHLAYLALFSSAQLSSWMSKLPEQIPLSSLSIPGTHNSPTCHVALPSVRCQAVSVTEQLDNGVRFLDVRVNCPKVDPNGDKKPELALVHAAFPIALSGTRYLSGLLEEVYRFLEERPSETVMMSLKREGTGGGSDHLFGEVLKRWYLTADKWYTRSKIPSLGEVRGKVVLVRRFHSDLGEEEGGIDGSEWPDNVADGVCGSGRIRIQDFYDVGRVEQIEHKIEYACQELERSARMCLRLPCGMEELRQQSEEMPLHINFLSASSFFNSNLWPDKIAGKVNPRMVEYLCRSHAVEGRGSLEDKVVGDAATGVVVTDWVGHGGDWDLVRCIVGWNARLQLKI